jgi:acetyltransferase-like isoleucine patch superfamily enzyme
MITIFKLIYFVRKKIQCLILWYLRKEIMLLYKGRVFIHPTAVFDNMPEIIIDNSNSKIIIEENVMIRGKIRLLCQQNGQITIKKNTFLNNGCSINCFEVITIGENCLFGEDVKIYDHNHRFRDKNKLINGQGLSTSSIIIGNNCWFGSNVLILKKSNIGNNCIISAGSIIANYIDSDSLVKCEQNLNIY